MDGQQHNAPEQYFATPDRTPDMPDEDGPSFSLSPYDALAPVGPIQSHHHQQPQPQQQQQPSSYLESSGSAVSVSPHYGFNAAAGSGPSIYQTSSDWPQDNQQLIFANAASMTSFGYETYDKGQAGVQSVPMEDAAMCHGHRYVTPMDAAFQLGYGYNWEAQETTAMDFEPSPLQSPTGYTSMPVSPSGTGNATGTGNANTNATGTETPTSYASSSSGGQYPVMYAGASLQAQAAAVMGDHHEPAAYLGVCEDERERERERERESTPMPKRARTRPSLSRSSRPSLPLQTMPAVEKKEEKKTRSSHNLVEKQYRNRLNAQFEGLMLALPESLRVQGGASCSGGEGGDGMVASDAAPERKPSKAEVLEMARTHIRSLEHERDTLMNERDGLLGDIDKLQRLIESQSTEGDEGT